VASGGKRQTKAKPGGERRLKAEQKTEIQLPEIRKKTEGRKPKAKSGKARKRESGNVQHSTTNMECLSKGDEGNEARTKNRGYSAYSFASIRAICVEMFSFRISAFALRP
jgi:hypothetical protein